MLGKKKTLLGQNFLAQQIISDFYVIPEFLEWIIQLSCAGRVEKLGWVTGDSSTGPSKRSSVLYSYQSNHPSACVEVHEYLHKICLLYPQSCNTSWNLYPILANMLQLSGG